LPQPNPLRAFGREVEKSKIVLYDEPGSDLLGHQMRRLNLAGLMMTLKFAAPVHRLAR
jgi:hypothetical protein